MSLLDLVVVGFPKCGTTALMGMLEKASGVQVDRFGDDNGEIEAPFYMDEPSIARLQTRPRAANLALRAHKFSAYIYDVQALKRIKRENPRALFVVCVREPLRSLLSWREMHRRIAQIRNKKHFVNATDATRSFYLNASLDDYYEAYARNRLRYTLLLQRMYSALQRPRMLVINQTFLAANPTAVLDHMLGATSGASRLEEGQPQPPHEGARPHVGFADQVKDIPGSAKVMSELCEEWTRLQALLAKLSAHTDFKYLA